jgi:WD40 repeat protein
MTTDYAFDAFISYRRKDGASLARALRRALLEYRLPKALRGEGSERRLSVYLDTLFERADQDFFEDTIKPALARSRFLIIVLTPSLIEPRSDGKPNWARQEIEYFRKLSQSRNILFTCDGDSLLPGALPELGGGFENAERVDIGALRPLRALRNPGRRDDEVLKLAATLLDVASERMPELRQEEARRRASRARRLSTVLALVVVAMAGLVFYARQQKELFRRQLATTYLNQAQERMDTLDVPAALPWLVAALAVDAEDARAARFDRVRFGTALRASPVPERIWFASGGEVRDAMFDPSGGRIVSFGDETLIRDARSGAVLTRLQIPNDAYQAEWSPDGTKIATVGDSDSRIWDARTGVPLTPSLTKGGVRVHFSADGKRVIVAGHGAQLFEAATGRLLGRVSKHTAAPFVSVAGRAPDDALFLDRFAMGRGAFLTVAGDDRAVPIWDGQRFVEEARLKQADNAVYAAVSPSGGMIVVGLFDGAITSWNGSTLRENTLAVPMVHRAAFAARFSPVGSMFVTWGGDSARLWDALDGRELTPPLSHPRLLNDAAFSSDGRRIVTASDDGTARIWDTSTGAPLSPPLRHLAPVTRVSFDPAGRYLLTVAGSSVYLWRLVSDPSLAPLHREKQITAIDVRGDRLVAASFDGTASVWQISRRNEVVRLRHGSQLHDVELSPDGTRVVTAAEDGTAILWDAATGRKISAPLRHDDRIVRATFSADGTRIATASHDGTARVWNAGDGTAITPPLHHGQLVTTIAFSPDGRFVVTASADRTARVWDAGTGQCLAQVNHKATVRDAIFSPDGQSVATASNDHTAFLWQWRTREAPVILRHADNVRSVRFDASGDRIITASDDHAARIWNARTGRPLTPRLEDASAIALAAFSPDGTFAFTASDGGTARLWDVATGSAVSPWLRHPGGITAAVFTPDGRWLATSCTDGETRLWELVADERKLADLARVARTLSLESIDDSGNSARTDLPTLRIDWQSLTSTARQLRPLAIN